MAEHLHPMHRLIVLHNLLAKRRKVGWRDIQNHYANLDIDNRSRRTIYNDLTRLKDQGAPIETVSRGVFFYAKPFSYPGVINPEEHALVEEVSHVLHQLAVLPPVAGMEGTFIKIRERLRAAEEPIQFVDFEQNEQYVGIQWLRFLYDGIRQRTPLKITYQDFGKPARTYSMSPYLLKEYRNRWHLYGFEHTRGRIYNLALDRIQALDTSDFVFRDKKPSDLHFLNDILGFTFTYSAETASYAPVETIQIAFRQSRAAYLETKPLHGSQQKVDSTSMPEGWVVYSYKLRQNRELVAAILEYGQDALVLAPDSLKEKIKAHVRGMSALYGDEKNQEV